MLIKPGLGNIINRVCLRILIEPAWEMLLIGSIISISLYIISIINYRSFNSLVISSYILILLLYEKNIIVTILLILFIDTYNIVYY